jgi:hypothetical protein
MARKSAMRVFILRSSLPARQNLRQLSHSQNVISAGFVHALAFRAFPPIRMAQPDDRLT